MDEKSVTEPIESARAEVKKIIIAVLHLEKQRLYEGRPRIKEDIKGIVKEAVE